MRIYLYVVLISLCACSVGGVTSTTQERTLSMTVQSGSADGQVYVGSELKLLAYFTENGEAVDVTAAASWSLSASVLSMNSAGNFLVESEGDVTVSVSYDGLTASMDFFASHSIQRLFFTSTTYLGTEVGGLEGADAKCQARAVAASLSGSYKAVLSTETVDARDRMNVVGRVINTLGSTLANNATDLWDGTVETSILDEYRVLGSVGHYVWTGSIADGTKALGSHCFSFSGVGGLGSRARLDLLTGWPGTGNSAGCGANYHSLFCLQVNE